MSQTTDPASIKLGLPKGRMFDGVSKLLNDAGLSLGSTARNYRPSIRFDGVEAKLLKPRAIVEMLATGTRDLGFAGADWVREMEADVVEVVDTGLDPVRLVAAAPSSLLVDGDLPRKPLVVASEYVEIARGWIAARGLDASLLRSYGATEVLPPDDADCIIDNVATGATLAANALEVLDEIMRSSTRLYASRRAMDDPTKKDRIERFAMLVTSVLEARKRVMVEVNVSLDRLEAVVESLPCMREPTISRLRSEDGCAVKAAVPAADLSRVIPLIKLAGGTDIVVTKPEQIIP